MSEQNGNEVLSFSLKRKELPLKLEHDDGQVRDYKLVEMDGTGRDSYMNLVGSRLRVTASGQPAGLKNIDKVHAELISRCLVDSEDKVVPVAMIQKWPASVQMSLYREAIKLCGLDQEAEKDAKND